MQILITGATGLLGKSLCEFANTPYKIHTFGRNLINSSNLGDITQHLGSLLLREDVQRVLEIVRPDVVVHAAAEGRVDFVEEYPELARDINVESTRNIAEVCRDLGIRFIFISSNAVYGNQPTPFNEKQELFPLNIYGLLKKEAEEIVANLGGNYLIIRPILMYGWPYSNGRNNPVVQWIENLRQAKAIKVVDDVFTQPLSVYDCARFVLVAADSPHVGIVNIAGDDHMSLYNFALTVCDVFELDSNLVTAAKLDDFKTLAPRPRDTEYDLLQLHNIFGFQTKGAKGGLLEMHELEIRNN